MVWFWLGLGCAGEAWCDRFNVQCEAEPEVERDVDQDGDAWSAEGGDCDDSDAFVHPDATESCDGVDSNCDGDVDSDCSHLPVAMSGPSSGTALGSRAQLTDDLTGDGQPDLIIAGRADTWLLSAPLSVDSVLSDAVLVEQHVFAFGDLDGDGIQDAVLIDEDQTASLAYGPLTDAQPEAALWFDSPASWSEVVGDVTGDGLPEVLLLGEDTTYLLYSGEALLGAVDAAPLPLGTFGPFSEQPGFVHAGGDTDGDGVGELLVDLWSEQTVLLRSPWSGTMDLDAAAWQVEHSEQVSFLGVVSASVGDIDGDGFDDVLVGSPPTAAAYLFYGPLSGSGTAATADATFLGDHDRDYLGAFVAGGGDLDGDGFPDLLLGDASANEPGWEGAAAGVYAVLDAPEGIVVIADTQVPFLFPREETSLDGSVQTGADLNEDGRDDFVGHTPHHADERGNVSVFLSSGEAR